MKEDNRHTNSGDMPDYIPSSGNVFKDLGLPTPDERLAKAKLAYKINRLIADQGLTQKEAADFLGPESVKNDRFEKRPIEELYD